MDDRIKALKAELNTALRQLQDDPSLNEAWEAKNREILALDKNYAQIQDKKIRAKQNAEALEAINLAYNDYRQGLVICYDSLFRKLFDCKLFSRQVTKSENLTRFEEAENEKYDVQQGYASQEFTDFVSRFKDYCQERLTLLEAETLVMLEAGLMAVRQLNQGVKDSI